jgi:hypothetical protein
MAPYASAADMDPADAPAAPAAAGAATAAGADGDRLVFLGTYTDHSILPHWPRGASEGSGVTVARWSARDARLRVGSAVPCVNPAFLRRAARARARRATPAAGRRCLGPAQRARGRGAGGGGAPPGCRACSVAQSARTGPRADGPRCLPRFAHRCNARLQTCSHACVATARGIRPATPPCMPPASRPGRPAARQRRPPAPLRKRNARPPPPRYHPRLDVLYALTERIDDVGYVTAFAVDPATGALSQVGAPLAMTGRSTCYIAFDRDARHAVVTNYWRASPGA